MSTKQVIFGCEGTGLSPQEYRFFASSAPWGFILFARNTESPDQVSRLTAQLREAVGWNCPILIDQEGGRVQRMRSPHWREYPPALDQIRATGNNAARAMYLRNRLIAEELHAVGIDVNCAPVADVLQPETHPIMHNRCYGSDVKTVIEMCRETVRGFLDGGVLPVLKHIPGYGRAVVDGHKDLPTVDVPLEELETLDFAPFKALNDIRMGMTAHIVFPAVDNAPATTSSKAMAMIRDSIGFDGLIMTDDISMEALSGTTAERSAAAIKAGCDLVLHCNGEMEDMVAVADACGPMTPQAQSRAERALAQRARPEEIDIPAALQEFEALLSG